MLITEILLLVLIILSFVAVKTLPDMFNFLNLLKSKSKNAVPIAEYF